MWSFWNISYNSQFLNVSRRIPLSVEIRLFVTCVSDITLLHDRIVARRLNFLTLLSLHLDKYLVFWIDWVASAILLLNLGYCLWFQIFVVSEQGLLCRLLARVVDIKCVVWVPLEIQRVHNFLGLSLINSRTLRPDILLLSKVIVYWTQCRHAALRGHSVFVVFWYEEGGVHIFPRPLNLHNLNSIAFWLCNFIIQRMLTLSHLVKVVIFP